MLLKPDDETLKALVMIGSALQDRQGFVPTRSIVDRLHRADADGVFDSGDAKAMRDRFVADYS